MANVVSLNKFRKDKDKPEKGTCSFHSVSPKTGMPIHGIAAMLHIMKQNGGPDAFLHKIATRAAENAIREVSGMNSHKRVSWKSSPNQKAPEIPALFW